MFSTTPNCTNEPSVCVAFYRQGWVPTTFTKGSKATSKLNFVWWQLQWLYLIIFHIWTYPHPPSIFSFTIYVYMWLRLYNIGWHAMYLCFIITFLDLLPPHLLSYGVAFRICIWPFCVLFLSSNLSRVYVLSKKLSWWFPRRIPLLQISMIKT